MKRLPLVLVLLAAAAPIAFFLAERIVDGPFPQLSKGKRFFDKHEPALNTFIQRLESDEQIEKLSCYSDEVWIEQSEGGPEIELTGVRQADYLKLCHEAKAAMIWRVEGGYLVYAGAASRYGRDFNIALIWGASASERRPDCSSVNNLRDFGACVVPLRGDWVIDYEWTPSDFESPREKELMELAEDVAETLSNPTSEP